MRTALLNAVSHDLSAPLASAKAAVESLGDTEIHRTHEERAELTATAARSLDRLGLLVADLLDMSRLQADALEMAARPLALDEVVPRALDDLGPEGHEVTVQISADLPEVEADPLLLQRVLANLIRNALRHNPPGQHILVTAGAIRGRVELRAADRGPGVPAADHDRIFLPLERLSAG